jgi:nicotinate phosphoribosyltransferase
MDIVEIDGRPFAKRGKFAGRKEPLRCEGCYSWRCVPAGESSGSKCPQCGGKMRSMLEKVVANGKVVAKREEASEVRERVLEQLVRIGEMGEDLRGG